MYSYILFDLDGTLTDPKLGITKSVQHALRAFGIEEDNLDKLEPFIGPPLLGSFMEFYGFSKEQGLAAIAKYREYFSVKGLYENEMYCGIPELLKKLKDEGCKLAVASSKPTEFVLKIMDHFDIAQYFDCILGSEMDGSVRGTKEEVVEEVLRRLVPNWDETHPEHWVDLSVEERKTQVQRAVQTPEIAMVGDRKFDVQGAHAFGLVAVAVSYGYAQGNELVEEGADAIAATVEELGEILLK